MPSPSDDHYQMILDAIKEGEVVLFLGAGVNLCGRPKRAHWHLGKYLPNATELSVFLANEFHYPRGEAQDLIRVTQYIELMRGVAPLYKKLHSIFDVDYPFTELHRLLATLPSKLRARSYPPYQLIVSTNYDDLLERAFSAVREPFDLVTYEAEGLHAGKFWHHAPGKKAIIIEKPNEYKELSLERRSVIMKIHGAVDRANKGRDDSFVITEDHYIDYLTHTKISDLVPIMLLDKLRNSSLLFLGYSLQDWNLRVILRHIWGQQRLGWKSWAVQVDPKELDTRSWDKRGVEILDVRLELFLREMAKRMKTLPHK